MEMYIIYTTTYVKDDELLSNGVIVKDEENANY